MTKYLLSLICLSLGLVVLLPSEASAQVQRPYRYEPPAGPTLSPYLLFSRRPTGVYDNYHAFVRPRLELRSALRFQEQQIGQLDRNLRDVRGDVRTLSEVRDAGIVPTGVGSSYLNYSHYYPSMYGR